MAMPRQPFQALVILLLATWFLRSSLAQPVLALPSPPPPPDTLCIPRERDALLEFKAGLVDPDNYLSLWRGEECCRWIGVECSNRTGHVVKLELDGSNIIDGPMEGEINPSLLPPHLGNLSNLLILDLSNQLHGCYSPDLAWLSQLWKLKYLGMSQVDLSAVVNWAHVVNMLPSLVFLELQSCGLRSTMPPPLNSNLTSLENLYLDSNSFNSSVGDNYLAWDLPVLKILSMYSCGVQGLIPAAVGNLTSIQSLVLDNNNFSGKVPSTFKKLKKLQMLRLSNNLISGDIEDLLLHRLPTDELQELHLQHNRLAGRIPARLEQFSSLSTLRLNDNKLFGEPAAVAAEKMARPRHLQIQVAAILLTTWFLVFLRSSSAAAVPALRPPPSPPAAPGGTLCIPRERDALLGFKAGLTDPSNYLSSWRGEVDCCRWAGVECSNRTGHVVKLQVRTRTNSKGELVPGTTIGGEISSSLLTLRHLKHLDLSSNNFGGRPIPEFIGGLGSLTHLLLANSYFGGRIPPHIGNLSSLLVLDLYDYYQPHNCYSPSLTWVSRLQKLRHLAMSGVDLSAAVDWAHAVNMLPSLVLLELVSCGLRNTMPLPFRSNLTSLVTLHLESNSFNSSFGANYLAWDLPALQHFYMDSCGIEGSIPDAVGNMTSIQTLSLSRNNFGMVPWSLKKLKKLKFLNLGENFIGGAIQDLLHRLPTDDLQQLYLHQNNFTGSLPDWLEQFSSLSILWLRNNKLSGEIPISMRELANLKDLRLDSNNLHGTITEEHFRNLTSLQVLWISNNSLIILVDNTWNPPFKLTSAGFRSCILGPHFPTWISQPTLDILDIANTSIHDSIPIEFWMAMHNVQVLELSENRFVGRASPFFYIWCIGSCRVGYQFKPS
ncbi:hypothetical protein ZWY2020_018750 [Hordeum vulgare]|nr:hypothetical protein ZWY2020_018750 [Hordeum vulgare]